MLGLQRTQLSNALYPRAFQYNRIYQNHNCLSIPNHILQEARDI